ncbi:hypothetical protein AGDE_13763 [Angomonas deanei]|nr:hypothetical protein AGDE_13763 [Angomonas deanei]|eukprot:EPY21835.1 hypothetical protein AGDE_13763 [Angomonas deanei]
MQRRGSFTWWEHTCTDFTTLLKIKLQQTWLDPTILNSTVSSAAPGPAGDPDRHSCSTSTACGEEAGKDSRRDVSV